MRTKSQTAGKLGSALATVALFSLTAPCVADEAERAWSASIGAGTDYTFRGVSQTMGDHAIEAALDISFESGLYAYAWGSNVDFVPTGQPDDGATYEIDLGIGYAADLGEDWSVDFALIRYLFPGTVSGVNYDYNELMATVWFTDRYSATVAYSGDVDGTGEDGTLYKLGATFGLPADTRFNICYGYNDVSDAYDTAYAFTEAALSRNIGNAEIALAYVDTFQGAESIYGEQATGSRFVLSLRIDW